MRRFAATIAIISLVVLVYAWQSNKDDTSNKPIPTAIAQNTAKPDYLHLQGGDITKADYRAGVRLALQSPAAKSGEFVVCAYHRGLSPLTGVSVAFGNQIPGETSDMPGWISVPGQEDKDGMYLMIAQTIINDECTRAFK